jgi:hypothetical protein
MDSTAELPYRLGFDFPRLALELARYRRSLAEIPAGIPGPYPVGKTYHWLQGDLMAWLTAARQRRAGPARLFAWGLDMAWLAVRSHHLTFEWRDPLPALRMHWRAFAAPAMRRLRLRAGSAWRRRRVS